MVRPVILIVALALATACAGLGANELSELARQDQAVRAGEPDTSSDDARRRRVLELLAEGEVKSPRDKFNAGLVLQHTGLEFRHGELVSLSAENHLLAHFLFEQALAGGIEEAAYLVAASVDRYLSVTQGIQKYGTNRVIDQESGKELLVPIDRSVGDEERKRLGVPPLEELLQRWPEQAREPHTGD